MRNLNYRAASKELAIFGAVALTAYYTYDFFKTHKETFENNLGEDAYDFSQSFLFELPVTVFFLQSATALSNVVKRADLSAAAVVSAIMADKVAKVLHGYVDPNEQKESFSKEQCTGLAIELLYYASFFAIKGRVNPQSAMANIAYGVVAGYGLSFAKYALCRVIGEDEMADRITNNASLFNSTIVSGARCYLYTLPSPASFAGQTLLFTGYEALLATTNGRRFGLDTEKANSVTDYAFAPHRFADKVIASGKEALGFSSRAA